MQNKDVFEISSIILEDFKKITGNNYTPSLSEYLSLRQEAIREFEVVDFSLFVKNSSSDVTGIDYEKSATSTNKVDNGVSRTSINNPSNVNQNSDLYFDNQEHNKIKKEPSDFEILKSIKDPWNN